MLRVLSTRYLVQYVFPALLAAAAAYIIGSVVFCQAPLTTDENSYVFQANNFLDGVISRPYPDFPDIFWHKMIIMNEEAGWLSRYPPSHSLWLVPGVFIGNPYLLVALGAGLALWMIAKSASLLGCNPVVPALLVLCSPFFLFTHGTLLSHTSGLLASALMLLFYILWRRTGSVKYAALAGLAWGWLCLNRTYTALWLAIPFVADTLIRLIRYRNRKELLGAFAFALSAATGVLLLLIYNYLAAGNPMTMTYLYYDSSEGPGFGPRHTGSIVIHHNLRRGLANLLTNLSLLDRWLLGFRGSAIVLAVLAIAGWNATWTPLLLSSAVCVWIGHVFFWYAGTQETGPAYYFETLPYLIVAAALGASRLWTWCQRFRIFRSVAAILAACLLVITSGSFMLRTGRKLRPDYSKRAQLTALMRAAPSGSLIFVEPGPHTDYIAFNPRALDSDPLIVKTIYGSNKAVMKRFPDRKFFLLRAGDRPELVPIKPDETYHFVIAGPYMHRRTGTNLSLPGGKVRAAHAGKHGAGWLAFGRRAYVFPGRFTLSYDMEISGCPSNDAAVVLDVASRGGRDIHACRKILGNIPRSSVVLEFTAQGFYTVEPRIYYTGHGDVTLHSLRIMEAAKSTE